MTKKRWSPSIFAGALIGSGLASPFGFWLGNSGTYTLGIWIGSSVLGYCIVMYIFSWRKKNV